MKRFYLSKIKQVNDPSFGTVWKHRLQEYEGIEYIGGEIKVDLATGQPTEKALLVLVGGINHKRLQGDAELVALPQVAHDMKVSAIHTGTKLKAKADIKGLGFGDVETENAWANADGHRDVLNHYGRLNNPDFDVNNFDIDES